MSELLVAAALVLVIEGLYPFISPGGYKRMLVQILNVPDRTVRTVALCLMISGVNVRRMTQPLWMLPQGVEEILPPTAARVEALRRKLLDLHARWGYDIVYPPIVEHLESLLTGTGHELDQQTFKLIDPLSGRTLGVHADMTPQVARIDASRLQRAGTVRLSYAGTVLRTRSTGIGESRSPMQLGAELFGHQGAQSDVEIVSLMLASLAAAGAESVQLDLGHVGVYRTLVQGIGLDASDDAQLFDIMQRKSRPELTEFVRAKALPAKPAQAILALIGLAGDASVISVAREHRAVSTNLHAGGATTTWVRTSAGPVRQQGSAVTCGSLSA